MELEAGLRPGETGEGSQPFPVLQPHGPGTPPYRSHRAGGKWPHQGKAFPQGEGLSVGTEGRMRPHRCPQT